MKELVNGCWFHQIMMIMVIFGEVLNHQEDKRLTSSSEVLNYWIFGQKSRRNSRGSWCITSAWRNLPCISILQSLGRGGLGLVSQPESENLWNGGWWGCTNANLRSWASRSKLFWLVASFLIIIHVPSYERDDDNPVSQTLIIFYIVFHPNDSYWARRICQTMPNLIKLVNQTWLNL